MNRVLTIIIGMIAMSHFSFAASPLFEKAVEDAAKLPHPRLFAFEEDFERVKALLPEEGALNACAARRVIAQADALEGEPVLERVQKGRRLLGVSRKALYRISHLAMAYRLTGDRRYLERGERELKAVCSFSDWNPSHFLDVGEMAFAVALGYDWLYDGLSEASRAEIAEGLYRLGLQSGLREAGWKRMTNNWGQVCRSGLIGVALALCDRYPEEAARLLEECVEGLPKAMAALAPGGCYPEGPGYWNYGMSYNVYGIAMLEKACGTDFGLCAQPGFEESGYYPVLTTGPSGRTVGTSDSSDRRCENTVLWWFSKRFQAPGVIGEKEFYAIQAPYRKGMGGWLPPLEVLWADPKFGKPDSKGLPLVWNPGGSVPIVIQRSSWKKDAAFACLKGGSPRAPHGHMDGGNFILEMGGVRWSHELGCEDYHRLEQMGISLWRMEQESTRWSVYRLNSAGHGVPSIDGALQLAKGNARIVSVEDGSTNGGGPSVTLDLTSLYPAAKSVTRIGALSSDGKTYRLSDSFAGLAPGAVVKWQMMTRAKEIRNDGGSLVLKDGDIALRMRATLPEAVWSVDPAEGAKPLDSPNDGVQAVSFSVVAPDSGDVGYSVVFELEK